jgi:hypothetical protein
MKGKIVSWHQGAIFRFRFITRIERREPLLSRLRRAVRTGHNGRCWELRFASALTVRVGSSDPEFGL